MLKTENAKTLAVYISAAVIILALIAGALTYKAVNSRRALSITAQVELDLELHRVKAAVDVAQESRILELERQKWDGYASQLQRRADERRDSLLTLVNPWHELPAGYVPRLAETENGYLIDVRCAGALESMLADCRAAGGSPTLCSTYRTQDYQQMLFDNKLARVISTGMYSYDDALAEAATAVAVPGTSEHQLGLAADIIDFWYTNLDYWQQYTWTQQWLMEHCWEYGFILRYPNGTTDITGIIFEPWHYRYVGMETASAIRAAGVTLEEYLENMAE